MTRGQALVRSAACLCLALGWLGASAQPDSPATTYGQSLYRQDDPRSAWHPFRPVLPDAGDTETTLEQRIDWREAQGGPFSPDLLEPLRGLGAARFSRGDYPGASAAWGRALHLVRVNEGLRSPSQRWLLEQLSEASLAGGRIAHADEQQRHLFELARIEWRATEPAMQAATARYAEWQRSAYLAGMDRERYPRLLALLTLFDDLLEEAVEAEGPTSRSLLPYLRGRLDVTYLLSVYPGEMHTPGVADAGNHTDEGKLDLIRFLEFKRDVFREGERTAERIQAILAADENAAADERADALLAQADWYQWHRRMAQSLPLYVQAWQEAGDTNPAWRHDRFGAPLELPPGIVFQPGRLQPPERSVSEVRLRFGVNRQGRAEGVACLCNETGTEDKLAVRALALVDDLRFRPRVDAGAAVDTPAVERRYVMRY